MKKILKISFIVGVLFALLAVSAFAASIVSVSGTDGANNSFPESEAGLTAETPLETTITLSGEADTANANISIMIFSENVPVYVNQIISGANRRFTLGFPVSLEKGRVYEIRMNIEGSTSAAKKLYFKSEPIRYGDFNNDKKVTIIDVTQLLKYISKKGYAADTEAAILEGRGDITGDGETNTSDLTQLLRYCSNYKISKTATERLSW